MKCECGGEFKPHKENIDGILVDCFKCDRCGKILYTSEQMKDFMSMKAMIKKTTTQRKIIILGHSYAITLPKSLEKIGLSAGQKVSMRMTGKRTLEVKFGEESKTESGKAGKVVKEKEIVKEKGKRKSIVSKE